MAKKNYELAYKDYKNGMSYKDMAAKYNVALDTVKAWKRRQWKKIEAEEAHKAQLKAHKERTTISPEEARRRIEAHRKDIVDQAKKSGEAVKAAKEIVSIKRANRPPKYGATDTGLMINRISQYFQRQDEEGRPYTRAGIILALDITKETYYRYLHGELDYLLDEHIAINNIDIDACDVVKADGIELKVDCAGNPLISFSDILQKALIRLEENAEERLYKKARPGDIFTMKQYGWTDEKSPGTVNNTLVIASAEDADTALRMLYGSK